MLAMQLQMKEYCEKLEYVMISVGLAGQPAGQLYIIAKKNQCDFLGRYKYQTFVIVPLSVTLTTFQSHSSVRVLTENFTSLTDEVETL